MYWNMAVLRKSTCNLLVSHFFPSRTSYLNHFFHETPTDSHFFKKWIKWACHFKENSKLFVTNDKIQTIKLKIPGFLENVYLLVWALFMVSLISQYLKTFLIRWVVILTRVSFWHCLKKCEPILCKWQCIIL